MVKYKTVECHSPECSSTYRIRSDGKHASKYCKPCKQTYPLKVLKLQTEYELPIRELLIYVSRMYNFHSGEFIAGVLKVFRKVLIQWINDYVGASTWEEFYREYKCKSNCCYITRGSELYNGQYSNKYWLLQKLKKDLDTCACLYKSSPIRDQIMVKIPNQERLQKLMEVSMNAIDLIEVTDYTLPKRTPLMRTPLIRTPLLRTPVL